MNNLTADRFSEFFIALWDCPPFAWQKDLALRVLENVDNPWPQVLALPTASGKTACIDIAVFALAAQAKGVPEEMLTAPRRIFFVVDRRIIVDEAFSRASRLAQKLRSSDNGILYEVASSLRSLAGGDNPLACCQLRGGMYRSDAWARSPTQPTIIASTVDQFGSRLLFRGYGRSFKAWPIQAGLTGNDALVLLDEAHCAVPFMETLGAVRKFRDWAEQPLNTPFHVTVMSATPPTGLSDIFRDISDEPKNPEHPLGVRQIAKKPTRLRLVEIQSNSAKATEKFAKAMMEAAHDLVGNKPLAAVIFANRVATARRIHRLLKRIHGDGAILLTGHMRPFDKDDILNTLQRLASKNATTRQLSAPLFVVATQTLEVGADLDFDVLISECASLDALRQRFGRLNRMGRGIEAFATILMRSDQAQNSVTDPVYGDSLAKTWAWLREQAGEESQIDMGIAALAERLPEAEQLFQLNAPVNHAPIMLPAHVDLWVQTKPEPMPTPDISTFLHGEISSSADVQVCWRADLDLQLPDLAHEALTLCPPAIGECLPVPIWFFRRWLMGDEPSSDTLADIEGLAEQNEEKSKKGFHKTVRRAVRWRGPDDFQVIDSPQELRTGDVIVIPCSSGGWDTLGDLAQKKDELVPVLDWGERAHLMARAKAILRLHPAVIEQWPNFGSKSSLVELAGQSRDLLNEDPDALLTLLYQAVSVVEKDETAPSWLRVVAESLFNDRQLNRLITMHPSGEGIVLRGTRRINIRAKLADFVEDPDSFQDEDDPSGSGTAQIGLTEHMEGAAQYAKASAINCRLPVPLVEANFSAGLIHDLGKADSRQQAVFRKGIPWIGGKLLAKSAEMPQGYFAYIRTCQMAGYPIGARHELLSIRLVESAKESLPQDCEIRDLVLHLVASHHGYCRPFAPVVFDEKPVPVHLSIFGIKFEAFSETGLDRIDSGVPERFWRLTRRYGWWGLAWLEAIFRLSDHRQSEIEEQQRGNNG